MEEKKYVYERFMKKRGRGRFYNLKEGIKAGVAIGLLLIGLKGAYDFSFPETPKNNNLERISLSQNYSAK